MKDFKEVSSCYVAYHLTGELDGDGRIDGDGEIASVEVGGTYRTIDGTGKNYCIEFFLPEPVFEEEELIAKLELFINRIKNPVGEKAWTIEFMPCEDNFMRWGDSEYIGVIDKKEGMVFFLEPVHEKEAIKICEWILEVIRKDDIKKCWLFDEDEEYQAEREWIRRISFDLA